MQAGWGARAEVLKEATQAVLAAAIEAAKEPIPGGQKLTKAAAQLDTVAAALEVDLCALAKSAESAAVPASRRPLTSAARRVLKELATQMERPAEPAAKRARR